jgi:hypothetical protein
MPKPDLTKIDLYLMNWRDNYYFGSYKEGSHFFVLNKEGNDWDIVPDGSEQASSLYQQLCTWHDIELVYNDEPTHILPDWLPEIPTLEELREVKSIKWADNFDKDKTYPIEDYPKLLEMIKNNHSEEIPFYFVLTEDLYESRFGDGTFRYLEWASFNRSELESLMKELMAKNSKKYIGYDCLLKNHTLKIEGNRIDIPDFEPNNFEHYKKWKLLKLLEESLSEKEIK